MAAFSSKGAPTGVSVTTHGQYTYVQFGSSLTDGFVITKRAVLTAVTGAAPWAPAPQPIITPTTGNSMLTEQRVLKSVTIRTDVQVIEVLWLDQIIRDGEVIQEVPHRRAFTTTEVSDFTAMVTGAAEYMTAAGWTV